jgi:hypothetical protein
VDVEVELFGGLGPGLARKHSVQVDGDITASELGASIGLDTDTAGMVIADGVQVEPEDVLRHPKRVCFFPFLSGG